jgi:hypothetical protein
MFIEVLIGVAPFPRVAVYCERIEESAGVPEADAQPLAPRQIVAQAHLCS